MTSATSPAPTAPLTRAARLARVRALLEREAIRSQSELAALLAADGVVVTQATLSRDLDELGATKVRAAGGGLVYAVPEETGPRRRGAAPDGTRGAGPDARLVRLLEELLESAEASANLVVL